MSTHAAKPFIYHCSLGHRFPSDAPGVRATNGKGNPRYVCPTCTKNGKPLPKGWKLI